MPEVMTIGVDIGRTKIAAGLVSSSGKIAFKTRTDMPSANDLGAGFGAVRKAIADVFDGCSGTRATVAGIGICAPGPLDPGAGVVINPPNLPGWRGFALTAEVESAFGLPARLDNDANAAALAEATWGAGADYANVFYASIGSGIGTGIVIGRRIYHGRTGAAGEGGHVTIDYRGPKCACGKRGCIEAFCSGPAIALRARNKLSPVNLAGWRIAELAGGDLSQIRSEHVGQAFREGDDHAAEVLTETAELLAVWLGSIVDLLEPDVIVVGGGVAEMLAPFFDQIRRRLPEWSILPRSAEIPLVKAAYGPDAGIAGAAALPRIDR